MFLNEEDLIIDWEFIRRAIMLLPLLAEVDEIFPSSLLYSKITLDFSYLLT